MRAAATQFLRTFALVALCGGALYLAASAIASSGDHRSAAALWLGLVLSAALGVLTTFSAMQTVRTGEMPGRLGAIERDKEPAWYWALLFLESASAAALLAISLFCASRLFFE